jgi:hypothetical protein
MTGRSLRRVGTYGTAIAWIVENDDTEWLAAAADDLIPSITASLVADVFARTDEEVVADLRTALAKRGRSQGRRNQQQS